MYIDIFGDQNPNNIIEQKPCCMNLGLVIFGENGGNILYNGPDVHLVLPDFDFETHPNFDLLFSIGTVKTQRF